MKAKMLTSSCKAKGRALQNYVRDELRNKYKNNHPLDITIEDGDIESRPMGSTGTDIILSPLAKRLIPFDIECKAQESLNVWSALEQCELNTKEGRIPLLVFKRNRSKVYCVMDFDTLLKLI